jgi:hypothetical protein
MAEDRKGGYFLLAVSVFMHTETGTHSKAEILTNDRRDACVKLIPQDDSEALLSVN